MGRWPTKLIVLIAVLIVAIAAYQPEENYDFSAMDQTVMAATMTITPKPLEVKVVKWYKQGVARAKFKLHNPDELPALDPTISCTFYGASKTPIASVLVKVYVEVPGHKTVETDVLTIGYAPDQAKSISCHVS
jgi:hypothetical protein